MRSGSLLFKNSYLNTDLEKRTYDLNDYKTSKVSRADGSVQKVGNIVSICANISFNELSANEVIFNLPSDVKPTDPQYIFAFSSGAHNKFWLDANDGAIKSYGSNTESYFVVFNFAYII